MELRLDTNVPKATTMSGSVLAQLIRIGIVSLFMCCCLPFAFFSIDSTDIKTPHRVRFIGRYPTEKEVISPVYHVHHLPMNIDLKARYDNRRLSVQHGRQKMQARSSILRRFRRDGPQRQLEDQKKFVPVPMGDGQTFDLQCGSCALVTNSGYLRKSSLGRDIDQAECVFRMDAAPTEGYERDVGRRTTVRIISHLSTSEVAGESEALLNHKPSASLLIFHGPEHVFSGGPLQKYLQFLRDANRGVGMYRIGDRVEEVADFELLKHTGKSRLNSSSDFSSAFYALLTMRDVCTEIKVYGMLTKNFCSENPENVVSLEYFQNPSLTECAVNNYHENLQLGGLKLLDEKQVFEGWRSSDGHIRFIHPVWE